MVKNKSERFGSVVRALEDEGYEMEVAQDRDYATGEKEGEFTVYVRENLEGDYRVGINPNNIESFEHEDYDILLFDNHYIGKHIIDGKVRFVDVDLGTAIGDEDEASEIISTVENYLLEMNSDI